MRRALLPGLGLGIAAGLLFTNHDALALSVAWPIILGFALWDSVGRRGGRGPIVALAGAVGAGVGYGTFTLVAQYLPVTSTGLGVAVGVAVTVLVAGGLLLRERLPLPALLIGYGAFLGVFHPRWTESASNIRTHGLEDFTVAVLGLVVGILAATLVRAITDPAEEVEPEATRSREERMGDVAMRGGTS